MSSGIVRLIIVADVPGFGVGAIVSTSARFEHEAVSPSNHPGLCRIPVQGLRSAGQSWETAVHNAWVDPFAFYIESPRHFDLLGGDFCQDPQIVDYVCAVSPDMAGDLMEYASDLVFVPLTEINDIAALGTDGSIHEEDGGKKIAMLPFSIQEIKAGIARHPDLPVNERILVEAN